MHSCSLAIVLVALLSCRSSYSKPEPATKPAKAATAAVMPTDAGMPVAKEHSGGMERFRDPAVYVDGKPLGVLRFGEMPVTLKPVWFEERAAVPFKAGDKGPRYKIVKQRRYRFSEYLRAIGVKVENIQEMHIYGGSQRAAAVVIPGKNIVAFDDFLFRFGGSIWGKPLPACPAGVGDGKCPDQIGTVTVYVDKEPPKRIGPDFYLNDVLQKGIPYFGEPIRGGVRVYLDGVLTATIKRNKLVAADLKQSGTPERPRYQLFEFLRSQGVDTDRVQEAWIIQYDRHIEKLDRSELLGVTFGAGAAGSGEVLLGDEDAPTHVITLHSEPVAPEDLPVLLPEEIEKSDG